MLSWNIRPPCHTNKVDDNMEKVVKSDIEVEGFFHDESRYNECEICKKSYWFKVKHIISENFIKLYFDIREEAF